MRFRLEVSPQRKIPVIKPVSNNNNAIDLIPKLSRSRPGKDVNPDAVVEFATWGRITLSLTQTWQNANV